MSSPQVVPRMKPQGDASLWEDVPSSSASGNDSLWDDVRPGFGAGFQSGLGLPGPISDLWSGLKQIATHPINSASLLLDSAGQKQLEAQRQLKTGSTRSPVVDAIRDRNYPNAAGQVAGAATGGLLVGKLGANSGYGPEYEGPGRVGPALKEAIKGGAKAAVPDYLGRIGRAAVQGARQSWQKTAPRAPLMDAMSEAAAGTDTDALSQAASGQWEPPRTRLMDAMSEAVPQETDALSQAATQNLRQPKMYRDPTAPMEMRVPSQGAKPTPPDFSPPLSGSSLLDQMRNFEPGEQPEFLSDQETADYALQGGMKLPSVDEALGIRGQRLLDEMKNWRQERALYDPLSWQEGATPEQMQATRDFFRSPVKNWKGEVIEGSPLPAASQETGETPQPEGEDLTPILRESLRQAMLKKK